MGHLDVDVRRAGRGQSPRQGWEDGGRRVQDKLFSRLFSCFGFFDPFDPHSPRACEERSNAATAAKAIQFSRFIK